LVRNEYLLAFSRTAHGAGTDPKSQTPQRLGRGTGTFWTNMGDKSMNLLLPAPAGSDSREHKKPEVGKGAPVETGK
jgi:hypothetical protein